MLCLDLIPKWCRQLREGEVGGEVQGEVAGRRAEEGGGGIQMEKSEKWHVD